jgi:hypothetical protein
MNKYPVSKPTDQPPNNQSENNDSKIKVLIFFSNQH